MSVFNWDVKIISDKLITKVIKNGIVVTKYYLNGMLHREDGPAIEFKYESNAGTYTMYYLFGERVSFKDFKLFTRKKEDEMLL